MHLVPHARQRLLTNSISVLVPVAKCLKLLPLNHTVGMEALG